MSAQFGTEMLRLGTKDPAGKPGAVRDLQNQLREFQVLQDNEPAHPGTFDHWTDTAVRRLQWFASHVPGCLSVAGVFMHRALVHLVVDGTVGPHLRGFMQSMKDRQCTVTGLLVAVDMDFLSNVNPNSSFVALYGNDTSIGICEREFVNVVQGMNASATQNGIYVFVNQMFRVEGAAVSGAVVPPASYSAHKVGRAIDVQLGNSAQLVVGANPQLSQKIKQATPGTAFYKFRENAKTHLKCRYGGDFSDSDPPHFDRQIIPAGHQIWKYHYFFDQLQYRQSRDNIGAIPKATL